MPIQSTGTGDGARRGAGFDVGRQAQSVRTRNKIRSGTEAKAEEASKAPSQEIAGVSRKPRPEVVDTADGILYDELGVSDVQSGHVAPDDGAGQAQGASRVGADDSRHVLMEQAIESAPRADGGNSGESFARAPRPKGDVTNETVAAAADAFDDSSSGRGRLIESNIENARADTSGGRSRPMKTVRLPGEVVEACRRAFPDATTNVNAVSAAVACLMGDSSLAPDAMRPSVEARIRDGADPGGVAAAIRQLANAIARVQTTSAVGSMAAVTLISRWYEEERGRSGVPLFDWLGLTDEIFEVSSELASQSAQYEEALRRSRHKRPNGFGSSSSR